MTDSTMTENHMRQRFYPRRRQSVPAARNFAAGAIADWGFFHRIDDILLCVSELTTNALLHGVPPGRGFLVRVRLCEGAVLRVEVHDSGGGVPRVSDSPDCGGRGLVLVGAVADKWGVGERDPGKAVWCEFGCGGPAPDRRSDHGMGR
ncbi:ATP-binding protein [Streptomyces violascens]|uniref:ATP-binding protein n=1 Tax=Streptomyces violascens TaxID=67381 RepID=UPI0036BD3CA0